VRKQGLLTLVIYLLLGAVTGCNHKTYGNGVILLSDPATDKLPTIFVARGNALELRGASSKYPKFEVRFLAANPYNDTNADRLSGTNDTPIVIPANKTGGFLFDIQQIMPDGTTVDRGTHRLIVDDANVRKCPPACLP
jgi:hypothetical protein